MQMITQASQKLVMLKPHKSRDTAAFHVWKRMEKKYSVPAEYTPQPAARKLLRKAEKLVQSRRRILRALETDVMLWRQFIASYDQMVQKRSQFRMLPRKEQEARMKYGRQTRRPLSEWEEATWLRGEWAFAYFDVFNQRAIKARVALENAQKLRDKLESDIYSRRFAR